MVALLDRTQDGPRALPILKHVVAIPGFHQTGHSVDELPDVAYVDRQRQDVPFDIRDYPDVLAACRPAGLPDGALYPLGIWSSDLIQYARDDAADVWGWSLRQAERLAPKGSAVYERARRALFWREAKPLGILERFVGKNVITDNGATTMLKVIGSAAAGPFNHLQLATGALTDQVSATMGSTGATAIPVASGGASFTNGMVIILGYGSANQENVTVGAGSTGTSIVCSATAHTHAIGDWVVQAPTTSDNPSSVSNGYDSGALGSGAYTYSGTGAGNRQVQAVFNFPANSGAPGGGYTDLWVCNAATIVTNATAAHLTRNPLAVNATTGANVTYTDTE